MWRKTIVAEPTRWTGPRRRPRVLIEHHDPTIAVALRNLLTEEDYDVAVCTGPADDRTCPLVSPGQCSQAADADVVVYSLDVQVEYNREVLAALKERVPTTPIIVEIPLSRVPLYGPELEDCIVVPRPLTRETLLGALERSLR